LTFSPPNVTLPEISWSGSFVVQPVITAFDWRPFSDSLWLTVTSGAGPGAGSVQYTLAANPTGAPRSGHITVAGEIFTVTQTNQATFSACDLQQNGNIGVMDVQLILNEALGLGAPINDLNGDAMVNVVDVQIEANAVLGGGCVN
jgi:hypothetical protein